MKHSNEWANPDAAGTEKITEMVTRLEERARCPDQRWVNAEFIKVLDPAPGEVLCEVGSGSGVLCRQAAPWLVPDGKVVGIDISAEMGKAAGHFSREINLSRTTRFTIGWGERLPYADDVFDGAYAARLLLHAQDPIGVVKEMARVVKPSGRVVVMDWDFETVAVDHSNREITRRLLHWRTDHQGGDNWTGRKLLRILTQTGLIHCSIHPRVSIARSEQDSLTQSLWNASRGAKEHGIISREEQEMWNGELRQALVAGQFFASIVYFIVRGERA